MLAKKMRVSAALPLFLGALAICGCRSVAPIQETANEKTVAQPVVVYVVRHAEKAAQPADDPPLTERGGARAAALVAALPVASLVSVYSTPFQRTRDTVAPAAKAAGLPVIEIAVADLHELIARIRSHPKGVVLVAGHSNTVPNILRRLGVDETVVIGDTEFGDLFVVTLLPGGRARLERRRFGDLP